MGRATTRQAVIHKYDACKKCNDNTLGIGKCNKGYENFYYRKGKNNGCEKCMQAEKDMYYSRLLESLVEKKK